jgi:hypothetical protein
MLKLNFFLSWTPILLIFVLAIFYHASALKLAIWGVLSPTFPLTTQA